MEKYNWGIVGTGDIAEQFAHQFNQTDSHLYAVSARDFEKTKRFANKHQIPHVFSDFEAMIEDPALQIVYVAVPNQLHYSYIKKALLANKHVLCEKAMTLNYQELMELVQIANEKKLILQEAMTIFNMPLYAHLKERAAANEFGRLKMIQAPFGSYKEPDPTNRFFNPDLAGGALLDIGTYAVSFARYFMSTTPKVLFSEMLPFETGVDEQSITVLKNTQDEMATVALTFQAKMPKTGIVAYEKAYLTIPEYPRSDFATITYLDGKVESVQLGETEQALNYEIEQMVKSIQSTHNSTLPLTIDVIKILDTMQTLWAK